MYKSKSLSYGAGVLRNNVLKSRTSPVQSSILVNQQTVQINNDTQVRFVQGKGRAKRIRLLMEMSDEELKNAADSILNTRDRTKLVRERYVGYMKQVRDYYRREWQNWKDRDDARTRKEFYNYRMNILKYRENRKQVVLHNMKQHEDYMFYINTEYKRKKREKFQDRLNKESVASAYRIDQLRKMKDDSRNYVTSENLEDHIARQLNPLQVMKPTIFYDRLGVNDEVAYEIWNYLNEAGKMGEIQQKNPGRKHYDEIEEKILELENFVQDPLYPNAKVLPLNPLLVDEDEERELDALQQYTVPLSETLTKEGNPQVTRMKAEVKGDLDYLNEVEKKEKILFEKKQERSIQEEKQIQEKIDMDISKRLNMFLKQHMNNLKSDEGTNENESVETTEDKQ